MARLEGRAAWPSLFVFCAAISLLAAALIRGNGYRWAAVVLLVASFLAAPRRALPPNFLTLALSCFCGWLLLDAAFLTPVYSAEAIYRPAILWAGFAVAATSGSRARRGMFCAGAALLALLVLLGLLQVLFGFWHLTSNPTRAAATFITPNTFATAINLFLLPLVALCLVRRGGWPACAGTLWLFAGLVATESRGAYLGFAAGCAAIALWLGAARLWAERTRILKLGAGLLSVAVILATVLHSESRPLAGTEAFGATVVSRGLNHRPELAWFTVENALRKPILGHGAGMFRPLYERGRPAATGDSHIYLYSHNDYLQIWLEFGLLGLGLLAAVMLLAFAPVRTAVRADPGGDPATLACGAALASCFAHAVVDFPLYVPFLLLLVGGYLGTLAAKAGANPGLARLWLRASEGLGRARAPLRTGALFGAVVWLSLPVLADRAADRALSTLAGGNFERGLRWQAVARQLEPRNTMHYWAEGVLWREYAIDSGDRAAAARADGFFAKGIRVNPYEIVNYIDRARLRRRHSTLFDRPALPRDVLAWAAQAVKLRPTSAVAQAEYARSLAYAGRVADARRVARELLERQPDLPLAHALAAEL